MKYMLGAMAIVLALGGQWAAAEEIWPVSAPLEPMAKPMMRVGDKATRLLRNGKESTAVVVSMDEATATIEEGDGCRSIRVHEVFAEWLEWTNCPGSGTGTSPLVKGDVWPLEVGKKWRYKYTGKPDKGRGWKGKKSCKVEEQVRIKVPAGEFDTYHVVCNTQRIKKHYYMSPEIWTHVMYKRVDKYGKQATRSSKLVSFEPGEPE